MARPVKRRKICGLPPSRVFSPVEHGGGAPVLMTLDEFEALRLIDYLGLSQEECADQMDVARTTVQAIYRAARQKTAEALVCAKRLKIDGGAYEICPPEKSCCRNDQSLPQDGGCCLRCPHKGCRRACK